MAAHTTKLMLGPSVMLLPLRNPILVAQTVASLDILSGGRIVLGVGVGNDTPDLASHGGNARERATRSDESLEIIKRLWTEDSVTFHGKHFDMDDYQLVPKPVQKPHPRIHVGGGAASVVTESGSVCRLPNPREQDPRRGQGHVRKRRADRPRLRPRRLCHDSRNAPLPMLRRQLRRGRQHSLRSLHPTLQQRDQRPPRRPPPPRHTRPHKRTPSSPS